jgi:hypothetical protein
VVKLEGDLHIPPGKIVLESPLSRRIKRASMNGVKIRPGKGKEIIVPALPSTITLSY